jgi:hypothetical protein
MTDLPRKLSEIAEEERRLEERRARLLHDQRIFVAGLAEKANLLTVSEEILVGAFSEISEAITRKDPRIDVWRSRGFAILNAPKKRGRKPKTAVSGDR